MILICWIILLTCNVSVNTDMHLYLLLTCEINILISDIFISVTFWINRRSYIYTCKCYVNM